MSQIKFPQGFLWGTATASYQIEGAVHADGRKESVWDRFSHTPGKVLNGDTGDDACLHYEHWREDLKLIKDLGVDSYRFSIAWPRVIPGGTGAVNAKGLDFYERLVDEMLRLKLKPNATLYHWDLPQVLEDKGGWMNRDTAKAYGDYCQAVLKRLGDRVDFWATFNEPQIFIWLGYQMGVHAPGRTESHKDTYQAIHHVLLGHGLGMQAIREHAPKSKAGIVMSPTAVWPASDSAADLEASSWHWQRTNDWWMHPILKGAYPEAVVKQLGPDAPQVQAGDMQLIHSGLDFVGLNYYTPARTMAGPSDPRGYADAPMPADAPKPDFPGWEIFAPGLENLIVQYGRCYPGLDIYVTENGTSLYSDQPDSQGKVADPRRIDFIGQHLVACQRAIERGAPLKGYYVWSLMDNFEWGFGYKNRFGLVHVDFKTFKRSPKDSYYWYQGVTRDKGFEWAELPACPDFNFLSLRAGDKQTV